MVADTEAYDDYFVEKYTNSDRQAFLALCLGSVAATDHYLEDYRTRYPVGKFISTTFSEALGPRLFDGHEQYTTCLSALYAANQFGRVDTDIERRSGLYKQMYGGDISREFLAERTIRTMAQYLVMGEIIGQIPQSCIMVHDTVNAALFQDMNRFLGYPGDQHLPVSPVVRQGFRVYT